MDQYGQNTGTFNMFVNEISLVASTLSSSQSHQYRHHMSHSNCCYYINMYIYVVVVKIQKEYDNNYTYSSLLRLFDEMRINVRCENIKIKWIYVAFKGFSQILVHILVLCIGLESTRRNYISKHLVKSAHSVQQMPGILLLILLSKYCDTLACEKLRL